jgi:hypothetical protein
MSSSHAKYLRVVNPSPDDDYVSKRTNAINEITAGIAGRTARTELLAVAKSLGAMFSSRAKDAHQSSEFSKSVAQAISKFALAYDPEVYDNGVMVCAALAVLDLFENARSQSNRADGTVYLAAALGLTLNGLPSIDQPKVEELRRNLMDLSLVLIEEAARNARARTQPQFPAKLPKPAADEAAETFGNRLLAELLRPLQSMNRNAQLDREEVDLMWWALTPRESLLRKPASEISSIEAMLSAASELGNQIVTVPTTAHIHLALFSLAETSEKVSVENLTTISPESAKGLLNSTQSDLVNSQPETFFLTALLSAASLGTLQQFRSSYAYIDRKDQALTKEEWVRTLVLERRLLNQTI